MKNQNFDDLMASMGVRKLDRGENAGRSSPSASKPSRTKIRKAVNSQSNAPKRLDESEIESLRKKIQALNDELVSTKAQLKEHVLEISRVTKVSEQAQADLTEAHRQVERLAAEVSIWNGESDSGEGLLACLNRRGLKGEDERRDALMALGERRELDALLKRLKVVDASMVHQQLGRRLILCCGNESCRAAASVATIVVGANRCEICGGQPVEEDARRFVSGLLNMGWRRCTIYGGPDWAARAVQKMAHHSRLEIQLIPWSTIASHLSFQWDTQADCVVLWRSHDAPVEAWMNGCPESLQSVTSQGKTLSEMFRHAGSAILNID